MKAGPGVAQRRVGTWPVSARPPDRVDPWLPMFLFGLVVLIAPVIYRPLAPGWRDYLWATPAGGTSVSGLAFAPLQQFGTWDGALGDPVAVALYWFCALLFGPLVLLVQYHRRTRHVGGEPRTGWYLLCALVGLAMYVVVFPVIEFAALLPLRSAGHVGEPTVRLCTVVAAALFVAALVTTGVALHRFRTDRPQSVGMCRLAWAGAMVAIAAAAGLQFLAYLHPRNSYGPLLLIAIGLLAVAWPAPGRLGPIITVLYTVTALAANLVDPRVLFAPLGLAPTAGQSDATVATLTAFDHLVLPGAVLVIGGVIGLLAGRRSTRQGVVRLA